MSCLPTERQHGARHHQRCGERNQHIPRTPQRTQADQQEQRDGAGPDQREHQRLAAVAAIQIIGLLLQIQEMDRAYVQPVQRGRHCSRIVHSTQRQHGEPAIAPLGQQRIEPDFEAGRRQIGTTQ